MKQPLLLLLFCIGIVTAKAQSPGIIVRPAAGNGITPLNPNGDGFSSTPPSTGFVSSDISESEIPYKIVPPVFLEPTSDLMRGPAELFSDLVRQVDGSGFYVYNDGTNLLFRLRVGSIVSGSKGYSILIDTDGKMGNTGANADPDYQAATTGVNGNPGFELEVVLETNFRVAAYNVAGTSTPTLINSYGINTNSQISVALSTVSSTPDYFYDFYVPISALGITAATPLRMAATTVMAPTAAIGGPKSDIFGATNNDPMKSWEEVINNTPPITLTDITSGGGGAGAVCTAAPTVTSPVQAGSGITITGTWTALDVSRPLTATITLYRNGVSVGTTTVTSGNTWSIPGITVSNGQVLYAKAQASGESMCLQSNSVQVVSCSPANTTSTTGLAFTCISRKGIAGTRPANAAVRLYTVTTTGFTLLADDNSTTYLITYPTSTTWGYDGEFAGGSDPCSSTQNDIQNNMSYALTAQETSKCESGPVFECLSVTPASTPTITQTNLYSSTTVVSGNVASGSGATIRLYINGKLQTPATADGSGNYSFSNLVLTQGDVVNVFAQITGGCVSAAAARTVTCFTTPPAITTDNNGNLSAGSTTIAGRSGEPTGTVVTVLENLVSIGTTTVQSGGTWSFNYTPIATRSYTATQQNGSCAASVASTAAIALAATTVCPAITGTYIAGTTSVNGTLPSSFSGTIRLYLDGTSIGFTTVTNATTWTISGLNANYSNTLYAGGILTVTSQATGAAENTNCSSSVTLGCATPTTPVITPTSSSIQTGQTVTYNVTTTQSGIIYLVTDASAVTTNYAVSQWGTGSGLSLPTNTFNSVGTYNVLVQAVSLSGPGCLSSAAASITVSAPLPVTLTYFTGRTVDGLSQLSWETVMEDHVDHFAVERSDDGRLYTEIGTVKATGNSNSRIKYAYTDNNVVINNAWYRLRTVDLDGKARYSNVIRIANAARTISVLSVTPNPFESVMRVQVYSNKVLPVSLRIVDITGREMYKTNRVLSTGNNTMLLNPSTGLAKGVYVLQVIAGNEVVWTQRIQKAK